MSPRLLHSARAIPRARGDHLCARSCARNHLENHAQRFGIPFIECSRCHAVHRLHGTMRPICTSHHRHTGTICFLLYVCNTHSTHRNQIFPALPEHRTIVTQESYGYCLTCKLHIRRNEIFFLPHLNLTHWTHQDDLRLVGSVRHTMLSAGSQVSFLTYHHHHTMNAKR